MIKLIGVAKSFNHQNVIDNFSLDISSEEIHILLGASGSGKTTLLRMIGGLSHPDAGEIFLGEELIKEIPPRERTKKMAYITQEGGLFPHLTAKDNILLPMIIRKIPLEEALIKCKELCDLVSMKEGMLRKFPQELSGGQRQRVSLMRGLVLDPQVVLMDEPLSALDPIVRASLQQELRQIFKSLKKTVVMVTHDIHEASYMGDRISLLKGGRIIQTSPFKEMYHAPKDPYVKEFLQAQIPMEVE